MLREIFSFATLAVVHTGVVAGIAYSRGEGLNPAVTTGATSFGCALLGITSGAFAGHEVYDRHDRNRGQKGAHFLGVSGYMIGAVIGYHLR